MKAVQFNEYGGPEVLHVVDIDEPHAGPGQVRIAVRAAGVNPSDWKRLAGQYRDFEEVTFPSGIGVEASGVVDEVGPGVSNVSVGDAVFGCGENTMAMAQYALLTHWAHKPDDVSFEVAGGLPVIADTATRALDEVGVKSGETLLVSGAAGGIGSAVVQFARLRGITVIGTASAPKHDYLRGLGAIATTYGPGLAERVRDLTPGGVDAALDLAGSGIIPELIEIVGDPSHVLSVADFSAEQYGAKFSHGPPKNSDQVCADVARLCSQGLFRLRVERELSEHKFDLVGALTSLIAVVGFILVLTEGPEQGWTTPVTLLSLVVGGGGAIGFVVWELRQQAPLLDIRLFRKRGLASGSVSLLAVFGVPSGIFLVLYPYFQAVLGWSGLVSTVACMPILVPMIASSSLAPRMAARIGARLTMATGMFLGGAGLALMALLVSVDGGYLSVLPGMVAMGFGMGISMPPSTEAITSSLPREQQGVASALNDVAREFGNAIGVALLGAVLTAGYSNAINSHLEEVPVNAADTARKGIASALAIASEAHPYSKVLFRSAQESFVHGWKQAMWAGVIVMVIVFAYVFVRGPERTSSHSPE